MRIKRHTDTDGVSDKRLFERTHTVRNASLATSPESHEYVRRRVMYIAYKKTRLRVYLLQRIVDCELWCHVL